MKKLLLAAAIIFCAAGLAQAVVIDDFTQDRNVTLGRGLTAYPATLTDFRSGTIQHIIGGRCDITFYVNAGDGGFYNGNPVSSTNPYLNYFIGSESYEGECCDFDDNFNWICSPCTIPAYPAVASYNSNYGCRALWTMEYGKNANLNADLLTGSGTKIQLEILGDLNVGPRPVPCTISLISGKGSPQQATASVTQNLMTSASQNPSIISFNYSAFTGINFSDVDYIKVEMSMLTATQDAVDYAINWIKTDNVPTVIELSSFTAKASNGRAKLAWVTESEIDNAGFNIWRADAADGEYVKLNEEIIPAKGSETNGAKYFFTDHTAKNRKTYFYKLQDIDVYGTSTFHGPISVTPSFLSGIFNK